MFGGFVFHVSGFSGFILVEEGADSFQYTPKATDSPWGVLQAVAEGATAACSSTYLWGVDDSGLVTLRASGTFDLTMSTEIQGVLGFSSATYTGIFNVTSTTAPDGSFFPYSDGDGVLFTRRIRGPLNRGFEVYGGGRWLNTPGTNHTFPVLSVSCLRANVAEFMEQVENLGTPARVDLYEDGQIRTLDLGSISIAEQDQVSGWSRIALEVVG